MVCSVDEHGWCSNCVMTHYGHTLKIALSDTPRAERIRHLWRSRRIQPQSVPSANPAQIASPRMELRQWDACIHLGAHLTEEEVREYKKQLLDGKIPCRTCPGNAPNGIPARHCNDEVQGPFTFNGKCMQCTRWDDGQNIIKRALKSMPLPPSFQTRDIVVLCGGGVYQSSLWVTSKMIQMFDPGLHIVLYHGKHEALNHEAFKHIEVITAPPEVPAGWMMKSYALLNVQAARALFLDADFYPTASLAHHFDAPSGVKCANSVYEAIQWEKYGLTPDGRPPLDGGFIMIDKLRHWPLIWVFYYLNTLHYELTYQWGVGDQDQLRAALRGLKIEYDSIGQVQLIGRAAVYPGVGVHRFNDKFRGSGTGLREFTRRPVPDARLPLDDVAFKLFYEYHRLYKD